jgi:hypothetical protein
MMIMKMRERRTRQRGRREQRTMTMKRRLGKKMKTMKERKTLVM